MATRTTELDDRLAALLARDGRTVGDGVAIVALDRLAAQPFDPGMTLVILPPAGPAADAADGRALPGRHGHGADPVALLRRLYAPDHPVVGDDGAGTVGAVTLDELARAPHLLPPLPPIANAASPFGLAWLADRLRQPDGCPWDREQDHRSLRSFLLEETYEVYDALDGGSTPTLAEELGDLLLQVVLHAQYAAEDGVFDLADVQRAIMTKIVRRHPHVFGDVEAATATDVMRNWEQLKAAERAADADVRAANTDERADGRPADPGMPAAFAGLSKSLPALSYADEMQSRAAALGYDWPDLEGVIDKVAEEASELLAADGAAEREEEYGDLLFVIVNLGRKLGIDPEAALRGASLKFASRFARVERIADTRGVELRALGLDALDELWQEAKTEERETG
jgi:tetrapyrrole methylase family protein / MazG family protein